MLFQWRCFHHRRLRRGRTRADIRPLIRSAAFLSARQEPVINKARFIELFAAAEYSLRHVRGRIAVVLGLVRELDIGGRCTESFDVCVDGGAELSGSGRARELRLLWRREAARSAVCT